ncbi:hypothetical protein TYRP_003949 [Tyrophagus putrescentiae]|nr:hypothetical protein TYRP_003949 [Tyrophagus putrescentiae]
MSTRHRKTKLKTKDAYFEEEEAQEAEVLPPEPLHSLSIFNWLLLAFNLLYYALFLVDLVWALLCAFTCFSLPELIILGLLFAVNLLSTAAIVCFLLAVSNGRQEKKKVKKMRTEKWRRTSIPLHTTAWSASTSSSMDLPCFCTALASSGSSSLAPISNSLEFLWTSLASAVFVLLYEITFTGGSLLVYRLVWLHAFHHQEKDFIDEEQSPVYGHSAAAKEANTTPQKVQTLAIRALCDSMADSGKQAATAMEHFVESMRLDLPGRFTLDEIKVKG